VAVVEPAFEGLIRVILPRADAFDELSKRAIVTRAETLELIRSWHL
jgi:hypothetical protein